MAGRHAAELSSLSNAKDPLVERHSRHNRRDLSTERPSRHSVADLTFESSSRYNQRNLSTERRSHRAAKDGSVDETFDSSDSNAELKHMTGSVYCDVEALAKQDAAIAKWLRHLKDLSTFECRLAQIRVGDYEGCRKLLKQHLLKFESAIKDPHRFWRAAQTAMTVQQRTLARRCVQQCLILREVADRRTSRDPIAQTFFDQLMVKSGTVRKELVQNREASMDNLDFKPDAPALDNRRVESPSVEGLETFLPTLSELGNLFVRIAPGNEAQSKSFLRSKPQILNDRQEPYITQALASLRRGTKDGQVLAESCVEKCLILRGYDKREPEKVFWDLPISVGSAMRRLRARVDQGHIYSIENILDPETFGIRKDSGRRVETYASANSTPSRPLGSPSVDMTSRIYRNSDSRRRPLVVTGTQKKVAAAQNADEGISQLKSMIRSLQRSETDLIIELRDSQDKLQDSKNELQCSRSLLQDSKDVLAGLKKELEKQQSLLNEERMKLVEATKEIERVREALRGNERKGRESKAELADQEELRGQSEETPQVSERGLNALNPGLNLIVARNVHNLHTDEKQPTTAGVTEAELQSPTLELVSLSATESKVELRDQATQTINEDDVSSTATKYLESDTEPESEHMDIRSRMKIWKARRKEVVRGIAMQRKEIEKRERLVTSREEFVDEDKDQIRRDREQLRQQRRELENLKEGSRSSGSQCRGCGLTLSLAQIKHVVLNA